MTDRTTNLEMPYILPSQAQKHVTHNEALQKIDIVAQLVFEEPLVAPPGEPGEGVCYAVGEGATGAWSGRDGKLACWQDGAWTFVTPRNGWHAFERSSGRLRLYGAGTWQDIPLPQDAAFTTLGINATPDAVNRFALAAEASLFNNIGQGHRLTINKQSAGDTASLVFQTNWQGRAEFGTTGSDDFSIKVSPDGLAWVTALFVNGDGLVDQPLRPLVCAARSATTATPADGSRSGFDVMPLQQGGFSLGAAVPSGPGNRLLVPADGFYLLLLTVAVNGSTGHQVRVMANDVTPMAALTGGNPGGPQQSYSVTALASLAAGDWLCLSHSGNAEIAFGPGLTELTLLRL